MDNFLFTKEEAAKIFDDNISVRENKELLKKADSRFGYVVETIASIVGREFEWFDFSNENSYDNGNPVRGYFSPEEYANKIKYVGKFSVTKNKEFTKYDYTFPTSWLWTDFEPQLQEEVNEFEAKIKAAEEQRLKWMEGLFGNEQAKQEQVQNIAKNSKALQNKIYEKVPAEMRNNFSLKPPEQVYKERLDRDNIELQEAKKLLKEQEDYLRKILSPEEFEIIQFKKPEDLVQRANSKKMKR